MVNKYESSDLGNGMEPLAGLSAQELIKRKDDIEEEIKTQLLLLDGVRRGTIAYFPIKQLSHISKI